MAARHVHFRRHAIARGESRYAFAHRFHNAAEFVSKGEGGMQPRGRPGVPVVNVQVGAADGSGANADKNFSRARRRNVYALDLRARLRARFPESLHFWIGHASGWPEWGC